MDSDLQNSSAKTFHLQNSRADTKSQAIEKTNSCDWLHIKLPICTRALSDLRHTSAAGPRTPRDNMMRVAASSPEGGTGALRKIAS